jgi:hypothetical protein
VGGYLVGQAWEITAIVVATVVGLFIAGTVFKFVHEQRLIKKQRCYLHAEFMQASSRGPEGRGPVRSAVSVNGWVGQQGAPGVVRTQSITIAAAPDLFEIAHRTSDSHFLHRWATRLVPPMGLGHRCGGQWCLEGVR